MKTLNFSLVLPLLFLSLFAWKQEQESITTTEITAFSPCLRGTWIVRCKNGHDDQVDEITCNHDCEKDGCGLKSVDNGTAMVVCPLGHSSKVEGITEQHQCSYRYPNGTMCGQQCRR